MSSRWNQLADWPTLCKSGVHDPVNHDPTGGDPNLGGPVMLTMCRRCQRGLEQSDAARLFNQYQKLLREERDKHQSKEAGLQQQVRAQKDRVVRYQVLAALLFAVCFLLMFLLRFV